MGIDGIGRPSTPPGLDGGNIALESTTTQSGKAFGVGAKSVDAVTSTESTQPSSILTRLERGEVTREQYLDFRVDEAVSPFASRLTPDQLNFMRTTLREQLEIDPTLIELSRRATEKAMGK
jgi:hypothetical protein